MSSFKLLEFILSDLPKGLLPDSSVGKESACNAGDSGSIPGSGRFSGEGKGYPLQCSWASLVAQLLKNPPAMWETWVRLLGWEDPLEKGKTTNSSILAWRIPRTTKSWTRLSDFHFTHQRVAKSLLYSQICFFSLHTHTHTHPLMKVINIPVLIFHFSLFNLVTLSF